MDRQVCYDTQVLEMTEENPCSVSKRHVFTRSVSYDNEVPVRKCPVRKLARNLSYTRPEPVKLLVLYLYELRAVGRHIGC